MGLTLNLVRWDLADQAPMRFSGLFPGRIGFSIEYGGVTDDWEDLFQQGVVHGSLFAGYAHRASVCRLW